MMTARVVAVLLAAVPAWIQSFVAHYPSGGRPRSVTAPQCAATLARARQMSGAAIEYDPAYFRIPYPEGDVPANKGVCADVIVRSFRAAGVDLQKAVHDDMRGSFGSYPALWRARGPDPSIDHRRVPNLMTWFARNRAVLPLDQDFRPCDVVAWDLGGGVTHIGLVSGPRSVVHHIGGRPAEEDVLHSWRIIGHFAL
jgi:uncharacterized protein YijF (DUF1287 family)